MARGTWKAEVGGSLSFKSPWSTTRATRRNPVLKTINKTQIETLKSIFYLPAVNENSKNPNDGLLKHTRKKCKDHVSSKFISVEV